MNRFLKEVFGRKREEVTGRRRKLHLADLLDFFTIIKCVYGRIYIQ